MQRMIADINFWTNQVTTSDYMIAELHILLLQAVEH